MVALSPILSAGLARLFIWFSSSEGTALPPSTAPTARVAIIGGGPAGLSFLQGLQSVPEEYRTWTVDLFEGREDIGGTWLPDTNYTNPSVEPSTALYPSLHTNHPCPLNAIPGFPFPRSTPLHPRHTHILAYHKSLLASQNLTHHIHTSHRVLSVDRVNGSWEVEVAHEGRYRERRWYDHVVVATGRHQVPFFPRVEGEREWLMEGRGRRERLHSKWYRSPEGWEGRTVVIVGYGSGTSSLLGDIWKVVGEIIVIGKPKFHSTFYPNVRFIPHRLTGFHPNSLILSNNRTVPTPSDTILIYSTGYRMSFPFLKPLDLVGPAEWSSTDLPPTLGFNGKYIRPLYNSLFAIHPDWPVNALMFTTVQRIWAGPMAYVHGIALGHSIVDEGVLPSKWEALEGVLREEMEAEERGESMIENGHSFSSAEGFFAWPDSILALLRLKSKIPLPPTLPTPHYIEDHRVLAGCGIAPELDAWEHAVSISQEFADSFTKGAVTERDYAEAMGRFREWWMGWLEEEGIKVEGRYFNCGEVDERGRNKRRK